MRVINGTPDHGSSLCYSCTNCTLVQGHATSQELVVCDALPRAHCVIRHPVARCSSYQLRGTLSLYQMQQMATIIELNRDGTVGFRKLETKEFEYED